VADKTEVEMKAIHDYIRKTFFATELAKINKVTGEFLATQADSSGTVQLFVNIDGETTSNLEARLETAQNDGDSNLTGWTILKGS